MPCPDCATLRVEMGALKEIMIQWFEIILKKVDRNADMIQSKMAEKDNDDEAHLTTNGTSHSQQLTPSSPAVMNISTTFRTTPHSGGPPSSKRQRRGEMKSSQPAISAEAEPGIVAVPIESFPSLSFDAENQSERSRDTQEDTDIKPGEQTADSFYDEGPMSEQTVDYPLVDDVKQEIDEDIDEPSFFPGQNPEGYDQNFAAHNFAQPPLTFDPGDLQGPSTSGMVPIGGTGQKRKKITAASWQGTEVQQEASDAVRCQCYPTVRKIHLDVTDIKEFLGVGHPTSPASVGGGKSDRILSSASEQCRKKKTSRSANTWNQIPNNNGSVSAGVNGDTAHYFMAMGKELGNSCDGSAYEYLDAESLELVEQKSVSLPHFAVSLMIRLYRREELLGRNVYGKIRNRSAPSKRSLSPRRLAYIKKVLVQRRPCEFAGDPNLTWQRCVNSMNSKLRQEYKLPPPQNTGAKLYGGGETLNDANKSSNNAQTNQ